MAEFIPQNELETLFHAGFSDPARRPAYYRAFLEGTVIIMDANPPAPQGAAAGSAAPPEHADLRIRMMPIGGVTHLPVFTSMKRIEAHGHREGHYLEIRTRALLAAVPDTPVIVNPGSPFCVVMNLPEVAALLNGTLFRSNEPERRSVRAGGLEIGPLADPPFKLMGRMGQLFRLRPSVRAAYIFSTRNVDAGEQPHPLVGIDVEGEWDGLLREVMEIIDTHGRPGEVVDVFRLDDRPRSQQMRLQGTAFFQKK